MRFVPTELSPVELALQEQVREFLSRHLPAGSFEPGRGADAERDRQFSALLGARGWIGMSVPTRYGGSDRTAVDRFLVTEELLRWGAPVGYHWVADRQTAPLILQFGTDSARDRFLPAICRGELSFCIGMSEAGSGSDLASVQTRARKVDGGWLLNGRKLWTSNAQDSEWCVVLARSADPGGDRHRGLSQFIVDMHDPGVHIRPVALLDGRPHFGEVTYDDAFVPDELLLGDAGAGWAQVTSELVYERAGSDRWLSAYLLLERLLAERSDLVASAPGAALVGELTAQFWAIRRLSLSIARALDRGEQPGAESALVKEMGTRFEQDAVAAIWALYDAVPQPSSDSLFERLLHRSILTAPSFTIRGGTVEILRSVATNGLYR